MKKAPKKAPYFIVLLLNFCYEDSIFYGFLVFVFAENVAQATENSA